LPEFRRRHSVQESAKLWIFSHNWLKTASLQV